MNMEEEINEGMEMSSISAEAGATMRSYNSMRSAIEDKYIPPSIRNLSCSANIVFALLLGLASKLIPLNNYYLAVFFVMQVLLFDKINVNTSNISYSEDRLKELIDINLELTTMMVLTSDYLQHLANPSLLQNNSYFSGTIPEAIGNFSLAQNKLAFQSESLKDAQTQLSLSCADTSLDFQSKINPNNVELTYMHLSGNPEVYVYSIWEAIMEVVVCTERLTKLNISQVDDNTESSVYFISKNSLNNIMLNLNISSEVITDVIKNTCDVNLSIFLILLCVASFALVASNVLLIPVINNLKKNKQEVLELFMHIKKSDATQELEKVRKFLSTLQSNQETDLIANEAEENQQEQGEDDESKEKSIGNIKRELGNMGMGSVRRKFKKLVLNLGIEHFKFIFLILIMEGYFIVEYFLSMTFLSRASSLTNELSQLISRLPNHGLLLLMDKYLI